MSEMQGKQRSAVVFGARNLGRAVIELLVSDGWAVTGVARSRSTLDGVSEVGALALKADVTDPASVYDVLEQAAAAHGGVEFVLNAAAAYGGERTGPFGGGPIAEADLDGFDSWAAAPARAAFSFLSASGRFAIAQGRAATLVQVTGGSARRALPGRGLWAAGSFGVRAITNAAALELRYAGRIYTTDANTVSAESYTVVNWRVVFEQRASDWRLSEFLRVDNLFDRNYIGSVIVGDANRPFEPAPRRNAIVGINAVAKF